MLGADVSVFQGWLDPWFFDQYEFVIIRAFDRHGALDKRFVENWHKAYGRTLRGAYGWPKPGADNRALGAQLAAVAGDAEFGLWADFEFSPEYGIASLDDLLTYLDGIGTRHKGVYANIPTYREFLIDSPVDHYPWWVANYGPNNGQRNPLSLPAPRPYQIHQFTSRGGPGGSGLDLNWAEEPMIYPGAIWRPGRNAGYTAGRNRMRLCVCHFTVGRDSTAIGDRGYFHFLVARDGTVTQFAEADALTWHAGTANQWGPGIEVEYLPGYDDELWTPAQREATARLCEWLIGLGIPDNFYDGPRIDPSGFTGFLTHRSVQQPDGHSDWWPELPRVTSPEEDDMRGLWIKAEDSPYLYFFVNGKKFPSKNRQHIDLVAFFGQSHNGADNPAVLTREQFDSIPDA
jgi:hypothetical protein